VKSSIVLLAGVAWSLCGCILIPTPGLHDPTHRTNTSPSKFQVEIGKTTREEVLLALGEPDWHSPFGGGFLYVGAYVDVIIILAGQGGGVVIPLGHHQVLAVDFTENGLVKRASTTSPSGAVQLENRP
jgi:outer membrane protein assembly factor BamE (lipoprotein component of BamABCDE complex)